MPNLRKPGPQDASAIDDASLAALLAGAEVPPDDAAGLQPVADVLAALRTRPTGGELAGEAAALAEFRRRVGVSVHPQRQRRRRRSVLKSLIPARAAAVAVAAALSLGGAAAAAFTGHLPDAAQRFAHEVLGAPDVHSAGHSPEGPGAPRGHSAFGLCAAYQNALKHDGPAQRSAIRRRLAQVAGGASGIAAYCHAVDHPGAADSGSDHRADAAHPSRPAHGRRGAEGSHRAARATSRAHGAASGQRKPAADPGT